MINIFIMYSNIYIVLNYLYKVYIKKHKLHPLMQTQENNKLMKHNYKGLI